ncbi:MAG: hypothetical protein ACM30E_12815, partial [Nitrososphaerales archaeon]
RGSDARQLWAANPFFSEELTRKIEKARDMDVWRRGAKPLDDRLDKRHCVTREVPDAILIATDGSQIFPDRHAITTYYLVNTGTIILRKGSGLAPSTDSAPEIFFSDEDVYDEEGQRGRPLLDQGLALCREVDDKLGIAWSLELLAFALFDLQEFSLAEATAREGVVRCRELGGRRDLIGTLSGLGMATLLAGNPQGARPWLDEALAAARDLGDKKMASVALTVRVLLCAAQGEPVQTLRIGAALAALLHGGGLIFPKGHMAQVEQAISAAREALGPAAAAAAWTQGRTMPLDKLIAEALGEATA